MFLGRILWDILEAFPGEIWRTVLSPRFWDCSREATKMLLVVVFCSKNMGKTLSAFCFSQGFGAGG